METAAQTDVDSLWSSVGPDRRSSTYSIDKLAPGADWRVRRWVGHVYCTSSRVPSDRRIGIEHDQLIPVDAPNWKYTTTVSVFTLCCRSGVWPLTEPGTGLFRVLCRT